MATAPMPCIRPIAPAANQQSQVHAGEDGASPASRQGAAIVPLRPARPRSMSADVDQAVASALDRVLARLQAQGEQWSNRALARRISQRGQVIDERRVREWRSGDKPLHVRSVCRMGEAVARRFFADLTTRLWGVGDGQGSQVPLEQLTLPFPKMMEA
jgi:hypothetical protein